MRYGRPIAVAALLVIGLAWLYGGVVSSLVRQWTSDDNYSHGFFILPLAAFFAWERRTALLAAPLRPHAAGLAVVIGSLVVFEAGILGSELFLTRVSLVGTLAGIVLFVWGRDHFRILAFPLAFLLLMIPLPAIVFNKVAFPLQLLASRVGEGAIALAGVPVLREGNVLQLPGTTLEVAEACSGIRSIISLLTVAVVFAYFAERRTAPRLAIALSAVPIAIVANAVRVAGTGLLSQWISPAAAHGFFHTFSGWLMFLVAFVSLFGVQRVIARARDLRVRPNRAAALSAKC
jgi:exosortase